MLTCSCHLGNWLLLGYRFACYLGSDLVTCGSIPWKAPTLACQHLNSGTNLRECKDQSRFKVQAVPVFRFLIDARCLREHSTTITVLCPARPSVLSRANIVITTKWNTSQSVGDLLPRNGLEREQCIELYTGCPRRNVPDFGRVFLMVKYTDITQNTSVQSWTVTEIMAREFWNFDSCYTLVDCQIRIKTGRNMWFL
jgi:hypothetical protein